MINNNVPRWMINHFYEEEFICRAGAGASPLFDSLFDRPMRGVAWPNLIKILLYAAVIAQ